MENLADFAQQADVATAARMVLDLEAAKFATASSLLRRSSPLRRRGSHDGDLFTGSEADEQVCRLFLYTGQVQTIGQANGYFSRGDCLSAARIIATYRPPNVIVDIAIDKSAPYIQTFSGGFSYYSQLWGTDVENRVPARGSTEIYDNEGTFLIAGGGRAENNGLPGELGGALVQAGLQVAGIPPSRYSTSDDDVGISLPILLIPFDPPLSPANSNSPRPVIDRSQLVGFKALAIPTPICASPETSPAAKNRSYRANKAMDGGSQSSQARRCGRSSRCCPRQTPEMGTGSDCLRRSRKTSSPASQTSRRR